MEVVAERAHSRAPAAAVKCGTENERIDMTNAVAKPMNFGLPRHQTGRTVPAVLALKKTRRPLPAVSVQVPVRPENRSRLRVLREAEMAAWNATTEVGFDTGHFERTQTVEKERRDLRAFGLIAMLAVVTVTISLVKTTSFTEGWASLVHSLHRLLN